MLFLDTSCNDEVYLLGMKVFGRDPDSGRDDIESLRRIGVAG